MYIALHDCDSLHYPNLPLMKLSAWHKARGDRVEKFAPLASAFYDIVYSSKVFSWTYEDHYLPKNTVKGGTGYGIYRDLPDEVEHIMPDYSLYPEFTASLGFVTRGCIRNCPWCIVPKKEGKLRAHADIKEFLRTGSRDVILMDNNILGHEHGIRQLEKSISLNLRIDCNQGLDARLIADDDSLAKLLSKVRWIRHIRLACDHKSQMGTVEEAVLSIRRHGRKKYDFFCYVLVNDIEDALERVEFLRELGVKPFAQPYREPGSKAQPDRSLKDFARWVNRKEIFNTVSWEDYRASGCVRNSSQAQDGNMGLSMHP